MGICLSRNHEDDDNNKEKKSPKPNPICLPAHPTNNNGSSLHEAKKTTINDDEISRNNKDENSNYKDHEFLKIMDDGMSKTKQQQKKKMKDEGIVSEKMQEFAVKGNDHDHHTLTPSKLTKVNSGTVLLRAMEDVWETYTMGRELGRGQFGITYLCTHKVCNIIISLIHCFVLEKKVWTKLISCYALD